MYRDERVTHFSVGSGGMSLDIATHKLLEIIRHIFLLQKTYLCDKG